MSPEELEVKSIVNRLQGLYPEGPLDENGEPEWGWRQLQGKFELTLPTPLMMEASRIILEMQAKLKHAEQALTALHGVSDGWLEEWNELNSPGTLRDLLSFVQTQLRSPMHPSHSINLPFGTVK